MLYNWQSIKLNPTTTTHKSIIYSVFSDKLSNWQSTHYNYIESQVPVPMSQVPVLQFQVQVPVLENGTYVQIKYQYKYPVLQPWLLLLLMTTTTTTTTTPTTTYHLFCLSKPAVIPTGSVWGIRPNLEWSTLWLITKNTPNFICNENVSLFVSKATHSIPVKRCNFRVSSFAW